MHYVGTILDINISNNHYIIKWDDLAKPINNPISAMEHYYELHRASIWNQQLKELLNGI